MRYDQTTRDIARKCDEDVASAIERNTDLVATDVEAMVQVAMMGAASAVGVAGGGYAALLWGSGVPVDAEATTDAMWHILRPMVLRGMERCVAAREAKAVQA